MNILQILPELNVGGVEIGTLDFSKYLVSKKHKSVVVSAGGELVKDLEQAGGIHYQLPVDRKSLFTMIKMIRELINVIRKENIDIVHARSRVPAWIAFFACRKTNAKFITTCHGYYSIHFFSRVMGWPKFIIIPSQVIGKHMIDDFGVPLERIRLIHRSVDLERFKFKELSAKSKTKFVIGIIGRLTPLKGHTYFLRAMAKVLRSLPYIKIWIIGDAAKNKEAYKEEIHILVRRLGLSPYVQFMGRQKNIPEILHKLNLLVLSTVTEEAFGRVIIEAQAVGVPVVATKVGGVVDIIDDEVNGILVPPKDIEAMAEAVIRILKDNNLTRILTRNAREKVKQKFSLELMSKKTIEVYKELQNSLNILIIKVSAIGDVILATASIRAIRKKFPHAKIFCLVGSQSRQILQRCPYIDEVIVYDFKNCAMKDILKIARELRKYTFDIVIDLQNNTKSHVLSFLSLARNRYGYANKKLSFLLNHRVEETPIAVSPVEHQFRTLEMLGISLDEADLELWISDEDEAHINELLESHWIADTDKLIGINLSASRKWITKNWPLSNFAKLCDELSARNIRVVITGSEQDYDLAEELLTMTKSKPFVAVGQTSLMELASLIKRCKVFLSADSAPLHIAAAVETPIVALFGPTLPLRHMPPAKNSIVIRKKLDCSPCYKSSCKTVNCMQQISVKEVLEAIEKLINIKK